MILHFYLLKQSRILLLSLELQYLFKSTESASTCYVNFDFYRVSFPFFLVKDHHTKADWWAQIIFSGSAQIFSGLETLMYWTHWPMHFIWDPFVSQERSYPMPDYHFCLWVLAVHQQLQEYEQKLFGSIDNINPALPVFPPVGAPSFSFGFPKANDPVPVPAFIGVGAPSIFTRPLEVPPQEFQFGAGHPQNISESSLGTNLPNLNGGDVSMDSWISMPSLMNEPASLAMTRS